MTVFLTNNVLFYLCIVLFILVGLVWIYTRETNKRLTQSIKLINDLYELSQDQSTIISELLGGSQELEQADETSSKTKPELKSRTDHLVNRTVSAVKLSIAQDLHHTEARALKLISESKTVIEQRLLALENQTQQLQQDSPELKMYNRANQLAKEGASIEDVMEASHLPRAEVEVLVGLHKHKKKSDMK